MRSQVWCVCVRACVCVCACMYVSVGACVHAHVSICTFVMMSFMYVQNHKNVPTSLDF